VLNSSLVRLRIVGYLEGTSFLVLLGIAMPLKYAAGIPEAVLVTGWIHGALFMAYVVVAVLASSACKWPNARLAGAMAAAVLPFGPFVFDWWLRRNDVPEKPANVQSGETRT
jgi:integral membrane protein